MALAFFLMVHHSNVAELPIHNLVFRMTVTFLLFAFVMWIDLSLLNEVSTLHSPVDKLDVISFWFFKYHILILICSVSSGGNFSNALPNGGIIF